MQQKGAHPLLMGQELSLYHFILDGWRPLHFLLLNWSYCILVCFKVSRQFHFQPRKWTHPIQHPRVLLQERFDGGRSMEMSKKNRLPKLMG